MKWIDVGEENHLIGRGLLALWVFPYPFPKYLYHKLILQGYNAFKSAISKGTYPSQKNISFKTLSRKVN